MKTLWTLAAISLGMVVFLAKSRRAYLRYPELTAEPMGGEPEVTVVIPARNEADNIPRAVSGFEKCEVIVVDDASSDKTAELAIRAGARVVSADPLASGWLGKPNACVTGARFCLTPWILFVDADTHVTDGLAAALVRHAERNRLDMVSAFLRQECRSIAERSLIPYAFALYFCGVSESSVLANGQCLLFRRSTYDAMGGHAAVGGSVIEDVALARVMQERGLKTAVVRAESAGSVRMYRSFADIWNGFEKNSFRFLAEDWGDGLQVVVASILLTSYIPVLASALSAGLIGTAAAFSILPVLLLRPWYPSWKDSLLAIPALYLFQAVALNAMAATVLRRRTLWKGRAIT